MAHEREALCPSGISCTHGSILHATTTAWNSSNLPRTQNENAVSLPATLTEIADLVASREQHQSGNTTCTKAAPNQLKRHLRKAELESTNGEGDGIGKADAAGVIEPTKFPVRPAAILILCAMLNFYTMVNLFPYVGVMVMQLMDLETTNEAGYYAGYVASAFTFGRFVSGYIWGNATDRIGRKPVIIAGLVAILVFSLAFGLSTSYSFAITSRLALGLMNGIMPALRASMLEICEPEHVVRGMNYLSGAKGVSLVMGTGIGGLLAQPAIHYPGVFSANSVFGKHPFILPNLAGAFYALVMLPLVICFLPETKGFEEANAKRRCKTSNWAYQQLEDGDHDVEEPHQHHTGPSSLHLRVGQEDMVNGSELNGAPCERNQLATTDDQGPGLCGSNGLFATPNVKVILFLACILKSVAIGFEEVYPLWALSTPGVGGLGWGPLDIGKVLVVTGLVMACCQLGIAPPIIKMLGIVTWQRMGCVLAVPAFLAVPSAKLVSWSDTSLFFVSLVTITSVNISISAIDLALVVASTSMVPSNMRGKMGGLFNTAESLGRFIGPCGFSMTFAWSVSRSAYDWVDYRFAFYVSAMAMSVVTFLSWKTLTLETSTNPANSGKVVSAPIARAGNEMQEALRGQGS